MVGQFEPSLSLFGVELLVQHPKDPHLSTVVVVRNFRVVVVTGQFEPTASLLGLPLGQHPKAPHFFAVEVVVVVGLGFRVVVVVVVGQFEPIASFFCVAVPGQHPCSVKSHANFPGGKVLVVVVVGQFEPDASLRPMLVPGQHLYSEEAHAGPEILVDVVVGAAAVVHISPVPATGTRLLTPYAELVGPACVTTTLPVINVLSLSAGRFDCTVNLMLATWTRPDCVAFASDPMISTWETGSLVVALKSPLDQCAPPVTSES